MMIVLSYFHQKKGPLVFYTFPEGQLDNQLSVKLNLINIKLANLLDQQHSEDFFTYSAENLNSKNYYFEIHSDWARGNKEMLMVSIILDQQISAEMEENLSSLCKEFSEQLRSKKEVYTAFYINDMKSLENEKDFNRRSGYDFSIKIKTKIVNSKELIIKNDALIKEWVNNLYFSIVELMF